MVGRGAGDAAIRHTLGRAGIDRDAIADALAELDPERERARAVVERRGTGPKTGRYLRSKGFSAETIATVNGEELG